MTTPACIMCDNCKPSVMLWVCNHPANRSPEKIEDPFSLRGSCLGFSYRSVNLKKCIHKEEWTDND